MPSDLPRTHFNRSRLTCLLADLALVDADEPGAAFAERWGLWLDVGDAIALSATLAGSRTLAAAPDSLPPAQSFRTACEDVRYALEQSIRTSCSPHAAGRLRLPLPEASAYQPYQRFYQAHQRDMELAIGPLRSRVRTVLAQSSPALRQLAALDRLLDDTLGSRESRLLGTVPPLLEKCFTRLRQAGGADERADGGRDGQPGGWWAAFGQTVQAALLAELELRLQPVIGLIEAFEHAGFSAQDFSRS